MRDVRYRPDALRVIREETLAAGESETGGLLLGVERDGAFDVVEATGPGPGFEASGSHFSPDPAAQHRQIADAEERGLVYLGEWHKHPGSLQTPSGGDVQTLHALLRDIPQIDSILVGITTRERGKPLLHTYVMDRKAGLGLVERNRPLAPEPVKAPVVDAPWVREVARSRYPEFAVALLPGGRQRWTGVLLGAEVEVSSGADGVRCRVGPAEIPGPLGSVYEALGRAEMAAAQAQADRSQPVGGDPASRRALSELRKALDELCRRSPGLVADFFRKEDALVVVATSPERQRRATLTLRRGDAGIEASIDAGSMVARMAGESAPEDWAVALVDALRPRPPPPPTLVFDGLRHPAFLVSYLPGRGWIEPPGAIR